jgi:hypothetical protein
MKPIILDTDIDTDCDDTGALAVLHRLGTQGEAMPLGIICSAPIPTCPAAVHAINAWYGRPDLPIGQIEVPDYAHAPAWRLYREHRQRFLANPNGTGPYHHRLIAGIKPPKTENAVALYRRLLANSADVSVTICAIGTLTALAQLLTSAPDEHSPLPGAGLVRQKVAELVTMALVDYPSGRDRFNWLMDTPSAAQVVNNWPTPLTTSSQGSTVLTGARFMAKAPAGQPVREAYAAFLGGLDRNRPSWDLIALLYAVRGLIGPFKRSPDYGLTLESSTCHHAWTDRPDAAPRRYVTSTLSDEALALELDNLMIASLHQHPMA